MLMDPYQHPFMSSKIQYSMDNVAKSTQLGVYY